MCFSTLARANFLARFQTGPRREPVHDEIIDRRVIFYFFFTIRPRVRNFERHSDDKLENYGDRKEILPI